MAIAVSIDQLNHITMLDTLIKESNDMDIFFINAWINELHNSSVNLVF